MMKLEPFLFQNFLVGIQIIYVRKLISHTNGLFNDVGHTYIPYPKMAFPFNCLSNLLPRITIEKKTITEKSTSALVISLLNIESLSMGFIVERTAIN